MYALIYVSSAVRLLSEQALSELLEKSRKHNAALGITGLLLYKDGNFMQMIEGPKEAVLELLGRIEKDQRHRGVIVLFSEDQPKREFEDWSMGFKRLELDTPLEVPGYSNFMDLPLTSEEFVRNPSKTMSMLLHFKKIT
jgi:hypothetical protein